MHPTQRRTAFFAVEEAWGGAYDRPMKKLILFFALIFTTFARAQHAHHAKHNMVLFGEDKIYASHIVYKVPHNFQVILEVQLPPDAKEKYLEARRQDPQGTFVLLLDHMDIRDIASATGISGPIQKFQDSGPNLPIAPTFRLERKDYRLIYFDELPLSLE